MTLDIGVCLQAWLNVFGTLTQTCPYLLMSPDDSDMQDFQFPQTILLSSWLQICLVHDSQFLNLNAFLAILSPASAISLWMTPPAFYCLPHPISYETHSVLLPH